MISTRRMILMMAVFIMLAMSGANLFLPALLLAGTVDLPRTGQTTSYAPGDDGAIQAGVSWPTPRLTDNGNGTVTDNLTGLMWLKDGNCFGERTWRNVLNTVTDFNANPGNYNCQGYTARYNDWRLPNGKELHSLIDSLYNPSGHPFTNVQTGWYWSSIAVASLAGSAWNFDMRRGLVRSYSEGPDYYVWPVRAGR